MPRIDFWYEFASNYAYLSAMRIEALADTAGVEVTWKPFLLGPIFAAQGLTDSPFNIFKRKGDHMFRDMERQGVAMGIPFTLPDPFPQNSLTTARVGLVALREGWGVPYTKAVYLAQFRDGRRTADPDVLGAIIAELGHDPEAVFASATTPDNKAALKARTEQALELGIFGAPTFITEDGELFWGDDRLEQALYWAGHGTLSGWRG